MTVNILFDSSTPEQQSEKIVNLIKKRILLLLRNKNASIELETVFAKKLPIHDDYVAIKNTDAFIKTINSNKYEVVIPERHFHNLCVPGDGQALFDQIFVEIENYI